jgi:hypothetical protein
MKPGIYASIGIVCRDHDGETVSEREEPAHSFTRNFGKGVYASFLRSAVSGAYLDTSGSTVNAFIRPGYSGPAYVLEGYASGWLLHPAGEGVYRGVVVGSSGAGFDMGQYNLQSPISHGVAAGNLQYAAQMYPSVVVAEDQSAISLVLAREFGNASGSDVTIAEVGLIGYPPKTMNSNPPHTNVLLTRDVLDTPVVVPDGGVVGVSHILRAVM